MIVENVRRQVILDGIVSSEVVDLKSSRVLRDHLMSCIKRSWAFDGEGHSDDPGEPEGFETKQVRDL